MKRFASIMFWVCIAVMAVDLIAAATALAIPELRASSQYFALGAAFFLISAFMNKKVSEG